MLARSPPNASTEAILVTALNKYLSIESKVSLFLNSTSKESHAPSLAFSKEATPSPSTWSTPALICSEVKTFGSTSLSTFCNTCCATAGGNPTSLIKVSKNLSGFFLTALKSIPRVK